LINKNSDEYLNKIDIVNKATDLLVDPIAYEEYINRITKFREEKKKIETKNRKILNIKDHNDIVKEVPRILNEIKSPKNKIQPNIKLIDNRDTINIKSLDKVLILKNIKISRLNHINLRGIKVNYIHRDLPQKEILLQF
jgi:hypothetical protein